MRIFVEDQGLFFFFKSSKLFKNCLDLYYLYLCAWTCPEDICDCILQTVFMFVDCAYQYRVCKCLNQHKAVNNYKGKTCYL